MWDSKPTNHMMMEENELSQDENGENTFTNKTGQEEHGCEGEPKAAQDNMKYDSDDSSTGRQRTVDRYLANRWLQAVANQGDKEKDRMDYDIILDRTGGLLEMPGNAMEPSKNMQDGADASLLQESVNQLQLFDYGPSHYKQSQLALQSKVAQTISQTTRRQVADEGVTQDGTMNSSTQLLLLTDGNLTDEGGALAQVTQQEDGMEAGSGNKPSGSAIESPSLQTFKNVEATRASIVGQNKMEPRTDLVTWSQITARGVVQGSAASPRTHSLLGTLVDETLTGEGSGGAPVL